MNHVDVSRHGTTRKQKKDDEQHVGIATVTFGDAPAGTWRIDPTHSSVSFSVGHLMSKVRSRFRPGGWTFRLTLRDPALDLSWACRRQANTDQRGLAASWSDFAFR